MTTCKTSNMIEEVPYYKQYEENGIRGGTVAGVFASVMFLICLVNRFRWKESDRDSLCEYDLQRPSMALKLNGLLSEDTNLTSSHIQLLTKSNQNSMEIILEDDFQERSVDTEETAIVAQPCIQQEDKQETITRKEDIKTESLHDDSDDETCSTEVTTTAQIQTQAEKRVQLSTLEEEIKVSKSCCSNDDKEIEVTNNETDPAVTENATDQANTDNAIEPDDTDSELEQADAKSETEIENGKPENVVETVAEEQDENEANPETSAAATGGGCCCGPPKPTAAKDNAAFSE